MTTRKALKAVLGENVAAIRAAKNLSQPKVAATAKRSGLDVGQTTVGRVERAAHAADVETIEALGKGLGVEPWQLLVPDLDVENPPSLGSSDLAPDERQLVRNYREASDGWKLTLRLWARTPPEDQPDLSRDMNILMTHIFDGPTATNKRVEDTYGTAPHVQKNQLHQAPGNYDKNRKP